MSIACIINSTLGLCDVGLTVELGKKVRVGESIQIERIGCSPFPLKPI